MKDCSTCARKPNPGTRYEVTPCSRCQPWEPDNDHVIQTMSPEYLEKQAGVYEWEWTRDAKSITAVNRSMGHNPASR